jgi:hypothetical protein
MLGDELVLVEAGRALTTLHPRDLRVVACSATPP